MEYFRLRHHTNNQSKLHYQTAQTMIYPTTQHIPINTQTILYFFFLNTFLYVFYPIDFLIQMWKTIINGACSYKVLNYQLNLDIYDTLC